MLQINVLSRINEDKNFFFDLLYVARKMIDDGLIDFQILFIGDVLSKTVYQDMIRLIGLFELFNYVSFTKKSIRFIELPDSVKDGYFLNFTIGNFTGYSGLESLNMGFKTIFYNTDRKLDTKTQKSLSMCTNLNDLFTLLSAIHEHPNSTATRIIADNVHISSVFSLNKIDQQFLKTILLGQ